MLKPICPRCGSVSVAINGKYASCNEPDCAHCGTAASFKHNKHHGASYDGNKHWRDPVALSMDGFSE